jgi:transporter family-2 protein
MEYLIKKMGPTYLSFLALSGGLFIALMVDCNSLMAKYSSPLFASWVAQGIGAITCLFFIGITAKKMGSNKDISPQSAEAPLWSYFGGIPSSVTVILITITVNSKLGLAGALAITIVGQVFFGILSDIFGFFGHAKRQLIFSDIFVMSSILIGSGILIYFRQ